MLRAVSAASLHVRGGRLCCEPPCPCCEPTCDAATAAALGRPSPPPPPEHTAAAAALSLPPSPLLLVLVHGGGWCMAQDAARRRLLHGIGCLTTAAVAQWHVAAQQRNALHAQCSKQRYGSAAAFVLLQLTAAQPACLAQRPRG